MDIKYLTIPIKMSNEVGSEDRLTKSEFAELIQHLSVQEILTVEYRISTKWSKLFSRKNVSTQIFICNLCVLEASSFKNLLAHIDGKKHKLQMERVKHLYHPDYTYPKNDKKELVAKTVTKKPENASTSLISKPVALISSQPTVVEENEKSENKMLQNKAKIKLPIVQQGNNLESNKSAGKSPPTNYQNKINDSMKITSKDTGKQSEQIKGDANIGNEKLKESKSACKLTNANKSTQNEVGNYEIEKASDTDKNESSKVTVTDEETKKRSPVTAEKRLLSDNKTAGEVEVKKVKIVINPAAALSLKASSIKSSDGKNDNSKQKPQYQTDKIIIPTVHKSKPHNDKVIPASTSEAPSINQPKFSVKSYSSKPSDNDVHGILGVEYVIKILKGRNDISPRYECGLCELVFDGFAMQRHLEGYNHRLKFCEKHFPTAIRHYRQYMQNVPEHELFKVMTPVIAKLALAIEQHHGRNLPYECYERDFTLNRHEILAKAFSCRHASEQYGPTFTHVVGSKEIDEFINNRHQYFPPTSSRTAIFDIKPGSTSSKSDIRQKTSYTVDKEFNSRHRHAGRENANSDVSSRHVDTAYKSYMSSGLHENMYPPTHIYSQADNKNVTQHVDDETYNSMVDDFLKGTLKGIQGSGRLREHRKHSPFPLYNVSSGKRKSLSPLRQNDIWQAYRHMVDQELHKLDEIFKQYRKDPETHPSYNEEWQKFWKRRKDELVTAGLDHRKYNYQPEWVRFIKIRIEEFYGQEVENLKTKSRERLCLPLTNDNVLDEKYHVQAPKISSSNEPTNTACYPVETSNLSTAPTSLTSSNDTIPQVVSVLRLMTALEDSLGSLGPKIIDLLSKALQAEKTNPSLVNAIILNDENCSIIETAKEKFKGLVITGLFEGSKKRVLKQVVNDAETLLKYANQFRQLLASQRSSLDTSINRMQSHPSFLLDSATVNVSSTLKNQQSQGQSSNLLPRKAKSSLSTTENLLTRVDKKELASKLAASLVAQGKTDFDPQQLQQLIAVYKLIEKKKRENKGTCSLPESTLSNKKALSDTLSDLLKPTSSLYAEGANLSSASQSGHGLPNRTSVGSKFSSNITDVFQQNNLSNTSSIGNCFPSSSFTSVLQNSSDNYFNNTAQSMTNAYGVSEGGGGNLSHQRRDYGVNSTNNVQPHQQNSNMRDAYSNQQYQNNNRMTNQNWGWNSNMEMNQNYNMGGPNNNYNQTANWQNF